MGVCRDFAGLQIILSFHVFWTLYGSLQVVCRDFGGLQIFGVFIDFGRYLGVCRNFGGFLGVCMDFRCNMGKCRNFLTLYRSCHGFQMFHCSHNYFHPVSSSSDLHYTFGSFIYERFYNLDN